jgi:LmbE family N-acetylglucosaminyl deacetylase
MNIVAHEDDDLLFQSPDVLHDIHAGKCVRTVYITAGERGGDLSYMNRRESGVEAAYAQMAGGGGGWTVADAGVSGHPMPLVTLNSRPKVSLVFMRLPAGVWDNPLTPQDETLRNLWYGSTSQMHAEDGSSAYTKQGLTSALTALMTAFQPDTIRTQNYAGAFGDGDHDDHHAAAYFAYSAHLAYAKTHALVGYLDYLSASHPQNVFDPDLTAKTNAFYAYLAWDAAPCGETPDCSNNNFGDWLQRQYTVTAGSGGDPGAPPSTGPITSFTAPSAGQTVSGTIDVAATARDQSGTGMWLTAFRLDNQSGSPINIDYEAPWGFRLDTTTLANGTHTLYVRGADHANNIGQDATLTFTVDNGSSGGGGGGTGGTDPVTSFTAPSAGQTVSGTIDVAATAQDQSGSGIWLTAFRVDTQNGSPVNIDYEAPWGFRLNTTTLANGTHTLYVRAADHAGHVGQDATLTFTVDNGSSGGGGGTGGTDPVTSFTAPIAGQTVSGMLNVAATAQDQSGTGIWLTAFRLDSQNGSPLNLDYEAPWGFALNTTQLSDGVHTLYVRAADNAGHVGQDAAVTFTVDNASGGGSGGGGSGGGTTGPTTTFVSPLANQTVSGTLDVEATVQDPSGTGIWLTAFRLDNPNGGPVAIDYSGPWGFSLDTTQLSDGLHTLFVRAEDNVLNIGPDTAVTFYVDNSGGT